MDNRIVKLVEYIKTHPFAENCLSDEQYQKVPELVNNEVELEKLYRSGETERTFGYYNVAYAHYNNQHVIIIIYKTEDYDLTTTGYSLLPNAFKKITKYYADEINFELAYTYEGSWEENKEELKNDCEVFYEP